MKDLPPLPADLTRFTAARLDLGEIFKLVPLFELSGLLKERSEDDPPLSPEEGLRLHQENFLQSIDDAVGLKVQDLFSALDDRVVTYQAPSDGILGIGQVIAIGVKDEKQLKRCLKILVRKLEQKSREVVVVKRRDCLGVEVSEFVLKKNSSPVTVSYTICDGWLVIGFQPQPVRGFIYRAKGKLPPWKPDPRTAATLAKVPEDRCVIQVSDPRSNLQWLLHAAPIVAGMVQGAEVGAPDPGIFPVVDEVNQHLFPNVCWCHDDGTVMRWESRDSLWLPLEFLGPELLLLGMFL
jgi:hypothetical protein